MAKFRKRAVVIDAVQFDFGDEYPSAAMEFLGDVGVYDGLDDRIYIHTLEGVMAAKRGDMIIKGVRGEFYACDLPIFEETYERAT